MTRRRWVKCAFAWSWLSSQYTYTLLVDRSFSNASWEKELSFDPFLSASRRFASSRSTVFPLAAMKLEHSCCAATGCCQKGLPLRASAGAKAVLPLMSM